MQTQIDFSPIESEILGLKCGRCNNDNFDELALYRQIISDDYDICRLKVPAEVEMASDKLNKMGLPFYFSGSIRRYKTRIADRPTCNYNYPDLVYEIYDGSQDQLLKEMLIGTWGTYPIGYYRTPYLSNLITKEKEIDCVFQYYKKFNFNKNYPDNSILFMRHGDLHVGFFALNIVNGNLESHIGGILEPYRKSHYFLDMLRYIKEFCIDRRLEYFIFGARNENAEVQRIFQFAGFTATGSENVFHIPSLLTYSKLPVVMKEIKRSANDMVSLHQQLFNELILISSEHIAAFNKVSFQLNNPDCLTSQKHLTMRLSFPVMTDRELLMVLKVENENTLPVTGYLRAFVPR